MSKVTRKKVNNPVRTKAGRAAAPEPDRVALLVLGMHRSGTSAVAGTFSCLGAELPKSKMKPTADNPKGYAESTIIMDINDRILKSAGSSWSDVDKFNPAWSESVASQKFKEEALDVLKSEFGSAPLIVMKDPRICRFASFWIERLSSAGLESKIVIVFRNPHEVVESLAKRDRFPSTYSYLLWLRHILDAEFQTRACTRSFLSYTSILSNWEKEVERIGQDLGIDWPRWSASVRGEVDRYLSDELRHNRSSSKALKEEPRVPSMVITVFEALVALEANTGDRREILSTLDDARRRLDLLCADFGILLAEGQLSEMRLIAERNERKKQQEQLEVLQNRYKELEAKQMEKKVLAINQEERLTAIASEKISLEVRLAEQDILIKAKNEQLTLLDEAAKDGAQRLLTLQAELVNVKEKLAKEEAAAHWLGKHITDLEEDKERFRSELAAAQVITRKTEEQLFELRIEKEVLLSKQDREVRQLESNLRALHERADLLEKELLATRDELETQEALRLSQLKEATEAIRSLEEARDTALREQARQREHEQTVQDELQGKLISLGSLNDQVQNDLALDRKVNSQLQERIGALERDISDRFKEIATLTKLLMDSEEKSEGRLNELNGLRTKLAHAEKSLSAMQRKVVDTDRDAAQLRGSVERMRKRITAFEQSTSWKLTRPLREMRKRFKK